VGLQNTCAQCLHIGRTDQIHGWLGAADIEALVELEAAESRTDEELGVEDSPGPGEL
jgi:hypothetical protein